MNHIPEKARCQSCGQPIDKAFDNLGTQKNGTCSLDYCGFCFVNGAFTQKHLTLEEMIKISVDNMVNQLGMPRDQAESLAREFLPKLKRWQTN